MANSKINQLNVKGTVYDIEDSDAQSRLSTLESTIGGINIATGDTAGLVKSGGDITVATDGTISVSSVNASAITGTIDLAHIPQGALEKLVTVADETARFGLTTEQAQTGDTVKQSDTGVMYIVVDDTKLSSADGYVEFTAGTATSVAWTGVTDKPELYTKTEVDTMVNAKSSVSVTGTVLTIS